MSTTTRSRITIWQLMDLIKWNEIFIEDWRSWIELKVWGKKKLSDFQEFITALDYVIDNEYSRFQENCDCDIDVSVDNYKDCKCDSNAWCAYLLARKAYDIYFDN